MNKTSVKCPRCHSDKLYKFGLDKQISQFLLISSNIKVSHVTIANRTNKFAPYFKAKADSFKTSLNLQSDDWHADETVIFINGKRYYLWLAIE